MIIYCQSDNYSHNKSLERFGSCVEWNINVLPLLYSYTEIDGQYLDILILDDNDSFHINIGRNIIIIDNDYTS